MDSVAALVELSEGTLLAASPRGLFRLRMGENEWSPVSQKLSMEMMAYDERLVGSTSHGGVLVSTDDGLSWEVVDFTGSSSIIVTSNRLEAGSPIFVGTRMSGLYFIR